MNERRIKGLFFIPDHLREEIEGDLLQRYEKDVQRNGIPIAKIKLALSIIKFFRRGIILRNKIKTSSTIMIGNYFKVMLRHLARHKVNAFVNILGLTTGITFALVIGVYVWGELQVNKQLKDVDRLYIFDGTDSRGNWTGFFAPSPMGKVLAEEYPQMVENYYRFYDRMLKLSVNDNHIVYQGIMGDSTLLSILGLPVLYGDPATALIESNSVVITEKVATALFGKTDVVGETVIIPDRDAKKISYRITAVVPKLERNSVTDLVGIDAQVFLTGKNNAQFNYPDLDQWSSGNSITYLKLAKGADVIEVEKKIAELKKERVPAAQQDDVTLKLKNLNDYYLLTQNGTVKKMILTLSGIAIFILILAVINFVNLSISGATARLKEIGVRKVVGSLKRQIAAQFLTESLMMTVFSGSCSLILYALLSDFFGSVFNADLLTVKEFTPVFWTYFSIGVVAVGILPGLYPSILLSSHKTVDSLKGKLRSASSSNWLSRGLVTLQFTISIFVFICAIIINNQISLLLNGDLGYDKSYLLTVSSVPRVFSPKGLDQMQTAKNEFLNVPQVESASLSWEIPNGNNWGGINIYPDGGDKSKAVSTQNLLTDEDYAEVYKIGMVDGDFMFGKGGHWNFNDIVISESGAKALEVGVGDKVRPVSSDTTVFTIKGITKDYTQTSMRDGRSPLVFFHPRQAVAYRYFSFRLKPGNVQQSVAAIETKWREVFPEDPFDYAFMDDRVAAMYKTEVQLKKAADIGTGVMAVIVAIGLLGMVSLAVSRRVKEIGVRKVLGASVWSILQLFSVEYIMIIGISVVIAIPLAWLEINNWLQGFAFRIELTWWMFIIPGIVLMTLAMLVVMATTRKAAASNLVDALRTE
jgi:putative ABC transport system permease protein